VPAYGPQNDVTLKMPAFEWVHVQLHQQKGMISLSPPTICNSAISGVVVPSGGLSSAIFLLQNEASPKRGFERMAVAFYNQLFQGVRLC
ncbi:hypothetical protein J8806_27455, partial [Klebsiella pneumoniae]